MTLTRPLVAAGVVAGSLGLSLGVGMTIAGAATSPSTTAPSTSQPSTSAPSPPMYGNCPNMGTNSPGPTGTSSSNL
jgi:hypothetical protein